MAAKRRRSTKSSSDQTFLFFSEDAQPQNQPNTKSEVRETNSQAPPPDTSVPDENKEPQSNKPVSEETAGIKEQSPENLNHSRDTTAEIQVTQRMGSKPAPSSTDASPHTTESSDISRVQLAAYSQDSQQPILNSFFQSASAQSQDTSNQQQQMVDNMNRQLAELSGRIDQSDDALETLGKHGRVNQLVPNEVIRASAGTGKTFQLSNRYLKLLALGQDPRQILATTFTKKAAGEILERIVQRLTSAALRESDAEQLSQFIDMPINRDDCRVLLQRLIRSLNGLQIGTLDSFFGQVARTFCFELDLPQNWTIVDEQDEARMQNRAIGKTLGDRDVLDLLHLLEKGEAPRGVGSQMRWAVAAVYPLYLQTALEAWKIPGAQEKLTPPTTDGLKQCLPVTQETHGTRGLTALENLIDLADAQRWDDVLKNTFVKNVRDNNPRYYRKEMPPQLVMQIESLIQHAADLFVSQLQQRNTSAYQLMEHFDHHYKSMKTATGDLRFDNVQSRLSRWVSQLDDPAKRMVARLDFHIQHLLLDEFQDTVPQQWRILYPIARSIAQPASDDNPTTIDQGTLFCVGDQKQAIYRWRGGDSRIFATVKERFDSVQERAMNTSYRSSPIVLNSVNEVFQKLNRHPRSNQWEGLVQQWQDMFQAHQASPNNQQLSGYVTLEQTLDEEEILLEQAAHRVAELYQETAGLKDNPISIGVLVPKNQDVAVMMGYLNKRNVPASEESGNALSDSAAIQLIISVLQLIDHPGDTASWFHFLHSPAAIHLMDGFSQQDLQAARLAFPAKQQAIWPRLLDWSQNLKSQLLSDGLGDTISTWARILGPLGNDRDRKRLKQAVAAAYQYESPSPMRTSVTGRFLQDLKQIDRTQARVRVMNIHQSKGLEFDIVVLTALESGMSANIGQAIVSYQPDLSQDPTVVCRYTSSENWELLPKEHQTMFQTHRREHFNEKLCQLYVGMTRARRALHMLVQPIKKEPPQSLAGILHTSLTDVEDAEGRLIYQSGDPQWHKQELEKRLAKEVTDKDMDAATTIPASTKSENEQTVDGPKLATAQQARRGLQRVSPSSLEGGHTFALSSLLHSQQRQTAFLKGEVIHGWFELIQWLDDDTPKQEQLRRQAAKLDINSESWEHWIPDFYQMLENQNTKHVLCRDYYLKGPAANTWNIGTTIPPESVRLIAQNERPFAILDNGELLNGFIDRFVCLMADNKVIGADIVDYKTDRFDDPADNAAIQERVAHYRPQLLAYKTAVAKLTKLPLEAITARLVFVSIDQVQQV